MAPIYGWGSTISRLYRATMRRQFTFYHSVPEVLLFDWPCNKKLTQPWSNSVVCWWQIKINLLPLLTYLIKLNLFNKISGMLQFYFIFHDQDCY